MTEESEQVPSPVEHRGRVERFVYESRNYAYETEEPLQKTALVYLPFGYDDADNQRRYNVVYLMHGRARSADYLFGCADGLLQATLDRMIEEGTLPPSIVVTPTYLVDEQADIGFTEEARALRPFTTELKRDLMPALAARYRTYARSSSWEDIVAARDHHVFGGFSFGGVATWYVFTHCLDAFRWFVPICADCWAVAIYGGQLKAAQTANRLAKSVERQGKGAGDFHIFLGSGTNDPMHRSVARMAQSMRRLSAVFTPENFTCRTKQGGKHDYREAFAFLEEVLPLCVVDDDGSAAPGGESVEQGV